MKKLTKTIAFGAAVGIALALGGVATSAMAGPPQTVTTLTASPTTIRSGESITFTVNGSTDTTQAWSFVGCYAYWINGYQINNQVNGAFNPLVGPIEYINISGTNSTLRFAGWSGETCVTDGEPATPATFDTGDLTTTPQLVIDPITIPVGSAISTASFPYTSQATGGSTPFNWATGGSWFETTTDACGLNLTYFVSALPTGVTVDETTSASGSAPNLKLAGTPTTVGSYEVCMELEGDTAGSSTAFVTIVVEEPKLPATGLDVAQVVALGGGASALAAIGVALVLVRRRRA